MPLSSEGRGRTFRQNLTLAVLLASVAGAVNAAGFFILGTHTSHMTGQVAAVGEALATSAWADAGFAASALISFMSGAAAATAILEFTQHFRRARYTPALALEILLLGGSAIWGVEHHHHGRSLGLIVTLCFAMGLQNALVTRISHAVIRTTHLTGVVTDLGIESVHLFRTWLKRVRGGISPWQSTVIFFVDNELERAGLHLSLVIAFVTGATVGPLLLLKSSELALAAPSVVLVGLIVLDWRTVPRGPTSPTTRA